MTKPLALQLYSVRDRMTDDRDGVLRKLAEIGYGAVEAFKPTDDPAGFRKVADDLGLTVCATHAVGLVRGMDPGVVFEAVNTLGTELVIVPGGIAKDEFTTGDGLNRVADLLNDLATQAQSHGLRLGYHNHDHELQAMVDRRHSLDVLAELLSPEVFLEIDTYWAFVGGADVSELLARHRERVQLLHVKDGPGVRGGPNVAVGQGSLPVPEIVAAAPNAWRVVEFDSCATDIVDAVGESFSYLSALGEATE